MCSNLETEVEVSEACTVFPLTPLLYILAQCEPHCGWLNAQLSVSIYDTVLSAHPPVIRHGDFPKVRAQVLKLPA